MLTEPINSWIVGNTEAIHKRAYGRTTGDLPEEDFWTTFGEADSPVGCWSGLLTGMAIYQHLSAPTSLRDHFRLATTQTPIGERGFDD